MEPSGTVILEPCDNSSMIIRSVKGIVYTTSDNIGAIERNSVNNKFLMLTNTSEFNNDNEVTIVETTDPTNTDSMNHSKNSSKCLELCRICANSSDHMISIFEDEGVQHELCNKIHKYLPIRITENDTLPLQVCYHCASTLLAWHDLAEGCLNAEQKLIEIQNELNSQGEEKLIATIPEAVPVEPDNVKSIEKEITNLIEFHTLPEPIVEEKIDTIEKENTVNDERCQIGGIMLQRVGIDEINYNKTENGEHLIRRISENSEITEIYEKTSEQQTPNKYLTNELELVSKAKTIINNKVVYFCEQCNKQIITRLGFIRHIRIHSDDRPCACEKCNKSFRVKQDLIRHMRDVHEKKKIYICDICDRAFANKHTRDDHRRIHTGEKPYVCKQCSKTFRTLNLLYIHNRSHTNYKPHLCSICGKCFQSKQRVINHITTHTGIKAFPCDLCGKRFSVKSEATRHRAIHNIEKPFKCINCELTFGQKRYLRNHIKNNHE
ncbi:hypothetical protein PV327_000267 [Microctonus hyperodae]|uniref:Uncharacterized protein n=1 Tax=Microctonus hyperodae TaxID=165561 RepID=A0AA39G652_MICHY|nr:hypothetical protein PV327_000267 [Microctonus hyperodae]